MKVLCPQFVAVLLVVAVVLPLAAQDPMLQQRRLMVEEQVRQRGILQPELLDAMSVVPRHLFVGREAMADAYSDRPSPNGWGGTLSQPYLSARMIELLDLDEGDSVLEIGTGSGYDAAVLAQIAGQVYTVEIDRAKAEAARLRFAELGYENVEVRAGDGYEGWPGKAPFDAILLTAASAEVPDTLMEQLKVNGRMVVAVGSYFQDLMVITKTESGEESRSVMPVRLRAMQEKNP